MKRNCQASPARTSGLGPVLILFAILSLVLFSVPGSGADRPAPTSAAKGKDAARHCLNAQLKKAMELVYAQNPQYHENVKNAEHRLRMDGFSRIAEAGSPNAQTYTIPIVFHIVHARGVENLPVSRIDDAMTMLEEDFTATNADISEVIASFQDRVADLEMEFKLAQIDPDGYPTSGITRDLSDYTYNGLWDWPQVKEVNYWPRDKYVNVWIVYSSDGGNGSAWAYLPSQVDNGSGYEHLDGIILSHWCVGYKTPGWDRILTHELGHVMNLRHTWGPGDFQGGNACNEDDYVTDTPNCSGYSGGCDTNHTSCGSLDNIQNYMDYSQCSVMYTEGQKTRVHDTLNSSVSDRNNLWSAANLAATLYSSPTPRVVYTHNEHANNLFMEGDANDGSIASTLTIGLVDVGSGEQFVVTSGAMTQGTHYSVANVPAGLTAVVTGTGSTTATVTLSGNATNHANANDVSNLTLTFLNAAFTGGNASALVNYLDNHLEVDFRNPDAIAYNDIADITCDSGATWTYFRIKSDSPYSSDFGTWMYNGNMLKLETYGEALVCNSGTRNITPLTYNTVIDGSSNWQVPGSYPDQLDVSNSSYTDWNGKTRYVGFQMKLLGKTHYGWMRLQVNANGTSMTLLDHAYNPRPETPIYAGSTEFPGGGAGVTAGFSFSTNNLTANFTDTSTASGTTISSWNWDFGDGGSSTQQNPSHTYTSAGTYTVILTVSDGGSNSDSDTQGVTVSTAPVTITADFTYTTNDLAASFTDTSTATNTTITNWSWNFGDGNSSTQQNPSHTYAGAGTYTVSLTVSDNSSNSDNTSQQVTVTAGGPTDYCSATHIYDYGYISNVSVGTIDNSSGWGSSGYADFTAYATTMNTGTGYPITVTCQNQHWPLNVIGIWVDWNQDGDFTDSGEEVLNVQGAGPYSTTITPPASAVSGATRMRVRMMYDKTPIPCGDDNYFGDVEDYTITVSGGGTIDPPVAQFTTSSTSIHTGQSVTFTDQSSNNPTSWSWSFSGGSPATSTVQNPSVTYNTAGTYSVTLTASNSAGSDGETKTNYITVTGQPITYCSSSASNQSYEWIAGVEVGNLNYTSGASGYSDFTAQSASLSPGSSVSVSLSPGFSGSAYTEYWTIWIDYNGDGDFEDTGEEVFTGNGNGVVTGSFTVPSSAGGTTRMRISMRYYYAPEGPCATWTYGEVEDYTVNF